MLERTEQYKKDPRNKILAQFELLPNYRFHRYVTGRSALEAAARHGNGRVAAFVSAPGSAGTLAAGDEIKARFPEAVVCALEPKECSTLFNNGRGTHRIEGIGDKMVTLIHNVLTTDYVMLIHDDDCVMGLELLERRQPLVEQLSGLPEGSLRRAARTCSASPASATCWAPSAWPAIWASGPNDNVVTIATDGFDRYPSVLDDLERAPRRDALAIVVRRRSFAAAWPRTRFWTCVRSEQKERLFALQGRSVERLPLFARLPGEHEVASRSGTPSSRRSRRLTLVW